MIIRAKTKTIALMTIVSMMLHSCATVSTPYSWKQHRQQLSSLTEWRLRGRISVTDNDQTVLANIDWHQDGDDAVIQIYGSFGTATHELHYNLQGAEIRYPNGSIQQAASLPELMQTQIGWSTPPMFNHWVRGLPGPGAAATTFDQHGRLATLEQENWHIDYLTYSQREQIYLPVKMKLTHDSPTTIVMAIHSWEIQP